MSDYEVGQRVRRKFDGLMGTIHDPRGCRDDECSFGVRGCVLVVREGGDTWEPWMASQTEPVGNRRDTA